MDIALRTVTHSITLVGLHMYISLSDASRRVTSRQAQSILAPRPRDGRGNEIVEFAFLNTSQQLSTFATILHTSPRGPPSLPSFTTTVPTDSVLIMESLYVPLACFKLIVMVKRTTIRRKKLMENKNLYPQTIVRV